MRSNDPKLAELFQSVNRQYFNGELKIRGIFWIENEKMNKGNGAKYEIWAYCYQTFKGIGLNKALQRKTPQYVIKYLIYHECLHFFWYYHSQSFRNAIKKFKQWEKAENWLKANKHLA